MKSRLCRLAGFVVLAAVAALPASVALAQSQKVLKFIPQADLRILDPISTTAYITRNHGYMVYDTLFAMDEKFQVKPQMVDKFDVSKDQLTYTFTLARRSQVPRWSAGAISRLHRVDRSVVQTRRAWTESSRNRPNRGLQSTIRRSA